MVVSRLDATVKQAYGIAAQQGAGRVDELASIARRRQLKRTIVTLLQRLNAIAELAAKQAPELAGKFAPPSNDDTNREVLIRAGVLLGLATSNQDLFISLGLGETFVADVTQATADFEAATVDAHAGRSSHVTATDDLGVLVKECQRDIRILNTYYRAALPEDSEILAGWRSATHIFHQTVASAADAPPVVPPAAAA